MILTVDCARRIADALNVAGNGVQHRLQAGKRRLSSRRPSPSFALRRFYRAAGNRRIQHQQDSMPNAPRRSLLRVGAWIVDETITTSGFIGEATPSSRITPVSDTGGVERPGMTNASTTPANSRGAGGS